MNSSVPFRISQWKVEGESEGGKKGEGREMVGMREIVILFLLKA